MTLKVWVPLFVFGTIACSPKNLKPPTEVANDANGDGIPDDQQDPSAMTGNNGGDTALGLPNFALGGTVVGLKRLGLVLGKDGEQTVEIDGNGDFLFPTRLKDGASFHVVILAQPVRQVCALAQADGQIATADSMAIAVTCTDGYTVGGTVYGLNTGASLTLTNNGGDALTIVGNGTFTFRTALEANKPYAVALGASTGLTVECNLVNPSGTLQSADRTDVALLCLPGTQPALAGAADWNTHYRYLKNQSGVLAPSLCGGQEAGHGALCIHGGERRIVDVPGLTACITHGADELGAFEWECEITTDGVVRYSTTGLKVGKGLADLIDFDTGAFRPNRLVINAGPGSYLRTPMTVWWKNTVVLNSIDTPSLAGAVYAYNANPARIFTVPSGGARVSIVIKPGVTASGTATAGETLITVADTPFVWIEGTFDATGDSNGIIMTGSRYPIIHRVTLLNPSNIGIGLTNTRASILRDVNVAGAGDEGIAHDAAAFAALERVNVTYSGRNASKSAVRLSSANNAVINQLFVTNQTAAAGAAITIDHPTGITVGNVLTQVTIGQAQGKALAFNNVEDTTVIGLTVHDNVGTGVTIAGSSSRNRFLNTIVANNGAGMVDPGPTSADLYEVAIISNTGTGLNHTGVTTEGTRVDFIVGGNGTNCTAVSSPACAPITPTTSPFVGTLGAATSVTNWFGPFDHSLQAWGTATSAACTGTACFKKDFALVSGDMLASGGVPAPAVTDIIKHRFVPTTVSAAGCEEQFLGSVFIASRCEVTALRAAIEISDGNSNGLCEDFEHCVFAQNIASDVGYGDYATQTLGAPTASPDRVEPVTLVRASMNGH